MISLKADSHITKKSAEHDRDVRGEPQPRAKWGKIFQNDLWRGPKKLSKDLGRQGRANARNHSEIPMHVKQTLVSPPAEPGVYLNAINAKAKLDVGTSHAEQL